jgi:tetratricopeptide (TPR) repeat protein
VDHPRIGTSLNNLAELYRAQGLYSQAEPLCQRALAIDEQRLGADHPDTAISINNLAVLYRAKGLYRQAEPLYHRALAICEQALGADHPDTAISLNNLALLFCEQGLYGQAEPLYQRALAIREQALGAEHPKIATSLNNLAAVYQAQGLYIQAETLYQRVLAICEKALGIDHPSIATSLNNLAELYRIQGLYSQAEPLNQRALVIREQALGTEHPDTAASLNTLALIYHAQGFYGQSELLCHRAISICEQALGGDHPSIAISINNLASIYQAQGFYSQAEPLYQRALAIREQVLTAEHPDTAISLSNLAYHRLLATRQLPHSSDYGCSAALFSRSLRARLAWLVREAPLMAAANRRQLPGLHDALIQQPMDMAALDLEFARFLLFARLNFHGLLQQIEQRQAEVAGLPGVHQGLVERLRHLMTVLASTQLKPEQRKKLAEERNDLEVQLYRLLPDLRLSPVELSDVSAALPALSALIEFQRYTPRTTLTLDPDTTPRYLAFILLSGESLEVIDLGPAPLLEAAIEEALSATVGGFADALEAWSELSDLLLSPLLAQLESCTSWFLSLDGELHRIPFHCLPLPGHPNQVLVEQIQLHLLTSGRDLLDRSGAQRASDAVRSALVVADPAFDHSPAPSSPDAGGHLPRSREMGALNVWPPLPGTAREGRMLAELLSADLRAGAAATTIAVQQAQHPLVLHIATHGFFLPNQGEVHASPQQAWLPPQGHDLLANFRGEDPLLRSGLVFAGANHPVTNPEDDDGYLTAQEGVQLNLQGTELVTLSACDTGRGDVHTGEGVYGLQRALIVAGARSLLLSLWQVPDDATCEFMVRFYTLLKEGAGRFDALVTVQREFRQHDNIVWRHPYYWAPWQLVGDGGPIEGL